jgi:hypothetical protein
MPRGTSRYDEAQLQRRLFDATNTALFPATYVNFNRRDSLTITSGTITNARNFGKGGDSFSSNAVSGGSQPYPPLAILANNVSVASFTSGMTLAQPTTSGLNNSDPTYTIISLARIKSGAASSHRVVQGGLGSNFVLGFYNTQWDVWYDSTGFRQTAGFTVTNGEFHLTTLRSSASYVPLIRGNGVVRASSGTVGGAPATLGINTDNFGERSDCEVFAIAAWYGALSDTDIYKVEGAFAWESGQQDIVLPISHPYKNRPPTIGG